MKRIILSSRAHRLAVLRNMVDTFASENTGPLLALLHGERYRQTQRDIIVARAALAELDMPAACLFDGAVEVEMPE